MGVQATLLTLFFAIRYSAPHLSYFIPENGNIFEIGRSNLIRLNLNLTVNRPGELSTALSRVETLDVDGNLTNLDFTQENEKFNIGANMINCQDLAEDIATNLKVIQSFTTDLPYKNDINDTVCTFSANPFQTFPPILSMNIDNHIHLYKSGSLEAKLTATRALFQELSHFSSIVKAYITLLITLKQGKANEEVLLLINSLPCAKFKDNYVVESIDCHSFKHSMHCDIVTNEKFLLKSVKKYHPIPYRNISLLGETFYSDLNNIFLGNCFETDICDFTSINEDLCSRWVLSTIKNNTYDIHTPCYTVKDERSYIFVDERPIILQPANIIFQNGTYYEIEPPTLIQTNENIEIHFNQGEIISLFPTHDIFSIETTKLTNEEIEILATDYFDLSKIIELGDSILVATFLIAYICFSIFKFTKSKLYKRKFRNTKNEKVQNKALVAMLNAE